MTTPSPIPLAAGATPAEAAAATVQAIKDNAQRLGLVWTIRPATVTNVMPMEAIFDGDSVSIGMTPMIPVGVGARVYVLIVPPSGNYVIGGVGGGRLAHACASVQSMTAGTTGSANFVAQPGSPSVFVNKIYDDTYLQFSWGQTYFTSLPVNALFAAITATGDQVFLAKHFQTNAATLSHTPISAVAAATGIPAGPRTWIGAWAQAGGGVGQPTVDGGDFWSMCVEEYWPT